MKRSEYEAAIRESGLDGISKAMLMQAASFKHWTDDKDPFLSIAILSEATGFGKAAVAQRYRLLQENGWLVPTGKKTGKQVSFYRLEIGTDFVVPARSKVSARETDDSEADLPGLTQGVCETDKQVSATQTAGCLSDRQQGVCEAVTENESKNESKNEPKIDDARNAPGLPEGANPSLESSSSTHLPLEVPSEAVAPRLEEEIEIIWETDEESLEASESNPPTWETKEVSEAGRENPRPVLDPSEVEAQVAQRVHKGSSLQLWQEETCKQARTMIEAGYSGTWDALIKAALKVVEW